MPKVPKVPKVLRVIVIMLNFIFSNFKYSKL